MKDGIKRVGAALLATLLLAAAVPGTTGCGGSDCLNQGQNCSSSYLENIGKPDAQCCGSRVCCVLANGSGVPTCQNPGVCE